MPLGVGLFLAACAATGFGVTYLSGIALTLEERIVFGAVLGPMAVSAFCFIASLAPRDVTIVTILSGLLVAAAIGTAAAVARRTVVVADLLDARRRWTSPWHEAGHPWPLMLVFVACGAWTVHFLHQAYVYTPAGLYAGYVNIWGDWAAHLSFAGSFAYGHNFPPEFPIDPGNRLGYPFMIDFFAADLVPLGASLTQALTATTGILALAFPAVLYLAARRFAGDALAAVIAVLVFLTSGGLGFVLLIGSIGQQGLGVLAHLPREYTLDRDVNLQWLNPVLAYLVPQRSTLFGFSLALIVLLLLWLAVRERLGWQPFLFAGVVAGAMPAFHVHAYGTVIALPLFWALFNRRRAWLAYFVPALMFGVPALVWMWPPHNTAICGDLPALNGYCIEPGWLSFPVMAHDSPLLVPWDFIWFWIANTSLLIPLILAGQMLVSWFPTRFPVWFAPMWLWFVIPNVVLLQPWDWDNTKFFIFWALLGSIVVGGVLAGLFRRGPGAALAAAAALVLLCASGALDLARASDFNSSAVLFTDSGGLKVADWVRSHTSPTATFAVADEHNNPIPTLAGRRELTGYPGWLWTYGLTDYVQKESDLRAILDGDPLAPDLVHKYHIDYVLIGPQELPRGASRAYWDQHGTLVYDDGEYAVYRVGSV